MAELYPYPRFSLAERDRRWKAVRAKMREQNIDVIVCPNNTGHSTHFQAEARYLSHVGGGAAKSPLTSKPCRLRECGPAWR